MIEFIGISLQLLSIITAHILNSFWTTSVWRISQSIECQSQSHIATDGQSISKSWHRAPSGAYDQIFITLWQLRSCFCGAPSLTRGRVCLLYMLLVLASVVILGSESLGSRDHIFSEWTTRSFYVTPARTPQKTSFIIECSVVAGETTCPQSCSLATAVVLSPVYTAVTCQWVYTSQ
jgi:hypothetical protein